MTERKVKLLKTLLWIMIFDLDFYINYYSKYAMNALLLPSLLCNLYLYRHRSTAIMVWTSPSGEKIILNRIVNCSNFPILLTIANISKLLTEKVLSQLILWIWNITLQLNVIKIALTNMQRYWSRNYLKSSWSRMCGCLMSMYDYNVVKKKLRWLRWRDTLILINW